MEKVLPYRFSLFFLFYFPPDFYLAISFAIHNVVVGLYKSRTEWKTKSGMEI